MNQTTDPFSQAFSLPINVFVGSMRGVQRFADEGLKAITGMLDPCGGSFWPPTCPTTGEKTMSRDDECCRPKHDHCDDHGWDHDRCHHDKPHGDDCCHDGWHTEKCRHREDDACCEKTRLFRWSVVSIRRGHEEVLDHGESLDSDCMSRDDFCRWMLARYVADHKLDPETTKYLRVYCREIDCWHKPPLFYREDQLEILSGIRTAIAGKKG